jgi:hypothetical protein
MSGNGVLTERDTKVVLAALENWPGEGAPTVEDLEEVRRQGTGRGNRPVVVSFRGHPEVSVYRGRNSTPTVRFVG